MANRKHLKILEQGVKVLAQDKSDYYSALKVKMKNKKWTSHTVLKKELEL